MRMPPFVLHSPSSITEAMSIAETLLDVGEEFDWISGGTDLLPNYKWHLNPKSEVASLFCSLGKSKNMFNIAA